MNLTPDEQSRVNLALAFYADEPCRICGKNISRNDISNGAVYAGYSANNESRSAHKECWEKRIPKNQWAYPQWAYPENDKTR